MLIEHEKNASYAKRDFGWSFRFSYRPIALTSCIRKVIENLILAHIEWFLEYNNLYPEMISSFLNGRCAADNILDLVTTVQQQKFLRRSFGALFFAIKGTLDNV